MYWNIGGEEKLQVRGWLISAILVKISHLQPSAAFRIDSQHGCNQKPHEP
jgi:hypothetical protein